jgi:RNA polymerase sigma-70 factor (ECF subfamily)
MQRSDTTADARFRARLVDMIPQIRAVALVLTADNDLANSLTQKTALRALGENARFPQKGNFKAWCLAFLHQAYQDLPRPQRVSGNARSLSTGDSDHSEEFRTAFWRLSPNQREILILTRDNQLAEIDIAHIRGCKSEQVRRQATRARNALKAMLTQIAAGDHAREQPSEADIGTSPER